MVVYICHAFTFSPTINSFAIANLQRRMLICARWITTKLLKRRGRMWAYLMQILKLRVVPLRFNCNIRYSTYRLAQHFKMILSWHSAETLSVLKCMCKTIQKTFWILKICFSSRSKNVHIFMHFHAHLAAINKANARNSPHVHYFFSKISSLLQSCFIITCFLFLVNF